MPASSGCPDGGLTAFSSVMNTHVTVTHPPNVHQLSVSRKCLHSMPESLSLARAFSQAVVHALFCILHHPPSLQELSPYHVSLGHLVAVVCKQQGANQIAR